MLAMYSQGQKRAVKSLAAGDVFGEVALLTKAPRQADCVAASRQARGVTPAPAFLHGFRLSCSAQSCWEVWLCVAASTAQTAYVCLCYL